MKAVIFGATGAVGKEILKECIKSSYYSEIYVLGRKSIFNLENQDKFFPIEINFDELTFDTTILNNADVFCALGTTLKQAGSMKEQKKIDYSYVFNIAKLCANISNSFNLVSSLGANKDSKTFYLRIKGQLEEDIKKLSIRKIRIYQPSLLLADRGGKRILEELSAKIFPKIAKLFFGQMKRYTPIKVELLAKTMVFNAAQNNSKMYYSYKDFLRN